MFDQYSRYRACAEIVEHLTKTERFSILDVGSGPECLLKEFLPDKNITFLDPLIAKLDSPKKISGDINSKELEGHSFDCVLSVDVLEHIPNDFRNDFLRKLSSLSDDKLVLGFPAGDTTNAYDVDRSLNLKYKSIYGTEYPWLEEHAKFGLPNLSEVVSLLESLGWVCQTIGHGHSPWVEELLGILIPAWEIPEMREYCLNISDQFNKTLYEYDFQFPYYREFVIASRSPLQKLSLGNKNKGALAEHLYENIISKAKIDFSKHSLLEILKKDKELTDLRKSVQIQVQDLNNVMKLEIEVRDRKILQMNQMLTNLNASIEEVSGWAKSLQAAIIKIKAEHARDMELRRTLSRFLRKGIGLIFHPFKK